MNTKKTLQVLIAVIGMILYMPIWLYLLYWLISHSNPDRLIWTLFAVYLPVYFFISILSEIVKNMEER